jgi:hypothetical protein
MFGGSRSRRTPRSEELDLRLLGPHWRARVAPLVREFDQEQEVRSKLYAKPPATQRTVEVLGPVERIAERPAA